MPFNAYTPTRTNLLRLKHDLSFANLGYDLLDQKRNILVMELLNLVDQTVDYQNLVDEALKTAYVSLEEAVLKMGKMKVFCLSSAVHIDADIKISARKIMGVSLPQVTTDFAERSPYFSPSGTHFFIDNSIVHFKEALKLMGRFAELKLSVMRLAREVKKTIRKVNALEKIAIPEYQRAVKFIENRLEENERDAVILLKKIKERLETKSSQGEAHE
ncbi:V-type ATP synthase subunit D [candidate division KSB1 bacterium]|nr:V-type ATP synthase subunit D [candidate division KSB1 bacterium]RQW09642.1 MAG: V-type ATP synthase subunit D [candidate division KSB1 bacterium]